jgi:hypothetical protein
MYINFIGSNKKLMRACHEFERKLPPPKINVSRHEGLSNTMKAFAGASDSKRSFDRSLSQDKRP